MKYGSVIFDMDGVLLNSLVEDEEWKFDAVRKALREKNLNPEEFTRDELRKFLGDFGREACIEICEENNIDPDDIWKLVAETTSIARIEKTKKGDFRLYRDARMFLEALKPRDPAMAVISNAPESAVETTMKFFNLKSYFSFYRGVESFEDLKFRKPHPDHLNIARAELKRSPELYIGDAESDIKAAKKAGMDAAWINRESSESDLNPEYTASDLEELGEVLDLY
ncbi:MAG: HAD family hydrolase [Candidatus Nanosalina sp.]